MVSTDRACVNSKKFRRIFECSWARRTGKADTLPLDPDVDGLARSAITACMYSAHWSSICATSEAFGCGAGVAGEAATDADAVGAAAAVEAVVATEAVAVEGVVAAGANDAGALGVMGLVTGAAK